MKKLVVVLAFVAVLPVALAQSINPNQIKPGTFQSGGAYVFPNVAAKQANGVFYADQYCTTAGVYDQTCISNAITAAGNNAAVILSPHTYNLTAQLSFTGLTNVEIAGSGAGTVLRKDGTAFLCTNCIGVSLHDIALQTVTVPTVVAPSALPTASGSTAIVIDRWGTGKGYMPTINDQDIVPTANGGVCVTQCISATQLNQSWHTGVIFNNTGTTANSNLHIYNLTGTNYDITLFDVSHSTVDHNRVVGGKDFAGIACWRGTSGSTGCLYDEFNDNDVSYNGFSGLLAEGDHVTISNNVIYGNGESGIKIGENSPELAKQVVVVGNIAKYNWYDGFDLSATYPHTGTTIVNSIASGNLADTNHGTGYYIDGSYWTVSGNAAVNNVNSGITADVTNSAVTGNVAYSNNTGSVGGSNQVAVNGNNNTVTGNVSTANGMAGFGIYVSGTGLAVTANRTDAGINDATGGNVITGNSCGGSTCADSGRAYKSDISFIHAGTTVLHAVSAGGGFTANLPANTGTIAESNINNNFSVGQTFTAGNFTGDIAFFHAGTTVLHPVSAGGGFTATIPANTGTVAENSVDNGFTVLQTLSAGARIASVTVSALPACSAGVEGLRRTVSDATAPTFLGTVTGGGAVHAPVFCNGSAWVAY